MSRKCYDTATLVDDEVAHFSNADYSVCECMCVLLQASSCNIQRKVPVQKHSLNVRELGEEATGEADRPLYTAATGRAREAKYWQMRFRSFILIQFCTDRRRRHLSGKPPSSSPLDSTKNEFPKILFTSSYSTTMARRLAASFHFAV